MKILQLMLIIPWLPLTVCDEDYDDDYDSGDSFVSDKSQLWTDGEIPYVFRNDELSGPRYTNDEKDKIRSVMNNIENQLGSDCIKFTEVASDCDVCLRFDKDVETTSCKTSIGMSNKSFATMGNDDCFENNGRIIQHELGHSIGLVHEQNRPDRDDHIDILWSSLTFSGKRTMRKRPNKYNDTYQTPYDFYSFMHYPATLGCMNDESCIVVKEQYRHLWSNDEQILHNYPDELSPVDIVEISAAYNCAIDHKVVAKYRNYVKKITSAEKDKCQNLADDAASTLCIQQIESVEFGYYNYIMNISSVNDLVYYGFNLHEIVEIIKQNLTTDNEDLNHIAENLNLVLSKLHLQDNYTGYIILEEELNIMNMILDQDIYKLYINLEEELNIMNMILDSVALETIKRVDNLLSAIELYNRDPKDAIKFLEVAVRNLKKFIFISKNMLKEGELHLKEISSKEHIIYASLRKTKAKIMALVNQEPKNNYKSILLSITSNSLNFFLSKVERFYKDLKIDKYIKKDNMISYNLECLIKTTKKFTDIIDIIKFYDYYGMVPSMLSELKEACQSHIHKIIPEEYVKIYKN